jgi:hypothetical protein
VPKKLVNPFEKKDSETPAESKPVPKKLVNPFEKAQETA